jgi:hypothetical protein
MCDLPTRSRIYCSYGAIEPAILNRNLPELTLQDQEIVSAILQRRAALQVPENPWFEWLRKNDWRAEGLLRFVGLRLPLEMTRNETPILPSRIIFDFEGWDPEIRRESQQSLAGSEATTAHASPK